MQARITLALGCILQSQRTQH